MDPSNDILYAAIFEARVMNLHASTAQLHQAISTTHPTWTVSVDRVGQMIHSSPDLSPFATIQQHRPPFSQRSLKLLFYLLSMYEQAFVSSISASDAARWHPLRYELCLVAAGVKPSVIIWIGPGYHSQSRARHMQDRQLVDAWVVNVWQRTVRKAQEVSGVEPGLLSWLSTVQIHRINAGLATGHPQDPPNWHSFTGRVLIYSTASPAHHLALVRWAFLQPHTVPGNISIARSPPSESLVLLPEAVISAALGYPCTRPATRGLDHLRTACFIYEDFPDGRAVVTGLLTALPSELNAALSKLHIIQRTLSAIVPGMLNLGVRFEPHGIDQGEANAVQLQRLVLPSGQPIYTPSRPRQLGMRDAYDAMRDELDVTLGSVPFRQSYAFSVYWAELEEVNVRCTNERLETL